MTRRVCLMARPIKNNADYFPHDADMRNDPRIRALRRKFGIEGYGVYSMLLEFLTDSDYFEFKNDSLSLELVAGDFDIETDKLTTILQYCFQLDLFQLSQETNVISCKSLDNRLEPLLSKRKRDRNVVIDSDNTQSKVKERKGKEIKGNDIKELGDKSQKHFLIINSKYANDPTYKLWGVDGVGEFLEMNHSKWPRVDFAEKFIRERDGQQFNDFDHILKAYNLYILNSFK
jgi:hypothetical protein